MPPKVSRATFEAAVYQNWAQRFGCTVAELQTPGTEVLPEEQFTGSGAIHIWKIGQRAFARHDATLTPVIDRALAAHSSAVALDAARLAPVLDDHQIRKIEDSVLTYLYPPDFRPVAIKAPFDVRQLTSADADALTALQAACEPEEVEEGEVSVEDEIGFGCFQGTGLVTVATGFRLTGFMDIGVLTHPGFRRRGLGKMTVTALCRWCIDREIIAQYRCRVNNIGSRAISASLNFNMVVPQQSIYLVPR